MMRFHRPKRRWTAWAALLAALALLASCRPAPAPTPRPTPTATLPAEPATFECTEVKLDGAGGGVAAAHYILNQMIITGPAGAVEDVIDTLGGKDAGFAPIQTCVMRHTLPEQPKVDPWSDASGSRGRAEAIEFPPDVRGKLTTSLYSIPADRSTEEVIQEINEKGRELFVFADPNYLTGPLDANPVSPCAIKPPSEVGGAPFEVGGSPFEVGGSPFEVGGSSTGGLGADAEPGAFWQQWAFEQIGLYGDGSGRGEWNGKGVTVAVFDTSPFRSDQSVASISDQNGSLDLALSFTAPVNALPPNPAPDASGAATSPVNVADHGLFAAGLVHAVAPASQIHLIRVLNEYGCGDLWTLNKAINTFVAQQARRGGLDNAVLNLSLGVHQPRDHAKAGWPPQIVSLHEALLNAAGRGAVIVAASGNDSYASLDARPMQLPADWPYVVGVAASNQTPARACYSNKGDVAAPGADGRLSDKDACQPRANECAADDATCPLGLISLATQSRTGYRFWVGTSFAAPLVSGQAALLLSSGLPSAAVPRCIRSTAVDHAGFSVVNVEASVRGLGAGSCR